MFLIRLLNLLRGYVMITIEGIFPERFLNICARRGIYLWNVRRTGKLTITACTSIRGFKLMRPIARKSRCGVSLGKRRGMPFYLHRHRHRKAFLAGALLGALILFAMTRFIWVIEVEGLERIPREALLSAAEEAGLATGVLSGRVEPERIRYHVMTTLEEVSWISVHVKGTKAYVEVKEREPLPAGVREGEPCSIVASDDGVVESIEAYEGTRLVEAGDVVRKGQVLIDGRVQGAREEAPRYVHAQGDVVGRIWRSASAPIRPYEEFRVRTGRSKSKHGLKFFNFYVKFFINDGISYETYDRISNVKKLSIGADLVLPFSFHYDNYYELEVQRMEIDREKALENARKQADMQVLGVTVLSSEQEEQDGEQLVVTYECLESIAEKQPIQKEDTIVHGEDS